MLNNKSILTGLFLALSITNSNTASDEMTQITVQTPDGSTASTSLGIINRFAKLHDLLETQDLENPNLIQLYYSDFTAQDLKNLFHIITKVATNQQIGTLLAHSSFKTLVSMLLAIDYLGLEIANQAERERITAMAPGFKTPSEQAILQNWEITENLINKIKQLATPELIQELPDGAYLTHLLLNIEIPRSQTILPDISKIYWRPDGKQFIAINQANQAHFYNNNSIREPGEIFDGEAHQIYWQPNGEHFVIVDQHKLGYIYRADGSLAFRLKDRVKEICWQPNSNNLIVIYKDKKENKINTYQIHDSQESIVSSLEGKKIYWQPNGEHFILIKKKHKTAYLYHANGTLVSDKPIATKVSNIYWQPNSKHFILKNQDDDTYLYNANGSLERLIDKLVSKIYWQPNSTHFILKNQVEDIYLYHADGLLESKKRIAKNVETIAWHPHHPFYFITSEDNTGTNNTATYWLNDTPIANLYLKQQLLILVIVNRSQATHTPVSIDQTALNLLPKDIIEQLTFYGYLNKPETISSSAGVSAGALVGGAGAASGSSDTSTELDDSRGVEESKE